MKTREIDMKSNSHDKSSMNYTQYILQFFFFSQFVIVHQSQHVTSLF
jgi:hypothetical protein